LLIINEKFSENKLFTIHIIKKTPCNVKRFKGIFRIFFIKLEKIFIEEYIDKKNRGWIKKKQETQKGVYRLADPHIYNMISSF